METTFLWATSHLLLMLSFSKEIDLNVLMNIYSCILYYQYWYHHHCCKKCPDIVVYWIIINPLSFLFVNDHSGKIKFQDYTLWMNCFQEGFRLLKISCISDALWNCLLLSMTLSENWYISFIKVRIGASRDYGHYLQHQTLNLEKGKCWINTTKKKMLQL